MATTQYRKFAETERIPSKSIKITLILSILAMLSLWAIDPLIINLFYSNEFNEVITLNFIVSFGVLLYGIADFFNKFIGAKGQGKLLRNSSFIVGFSVLVANFILVPLYGATGASWAKVTAGIVYLTTMLVCYRKTLSANR
jgi:O-antigen/teichoic acid export membrane protein